MLPNRNNSIKKRQAIFIIALFSFLFFSYPAKTQAAFWPVIDPIIKRMLDTVYATIQGIILGASKQAAVKMLNSQVDSLMSGNGSSTDGAAFITDWRDYLEIQPLNNTTTYMNSRLTTMTSGRSSSSGYSSEGFSGTGSYANKLVQMEKTKMTEQNSVTKMTYEGDPAEMFASGNLKNSEIFLDAEKPNNGWTFDMDFDKNYQLKLAEQRRIYQTQAIANQSFKSTTSGTGDNQIVTRPGILTKDSVANIENIPNNVIASANSIPEVISSVVSQMITKAIQKGFDGIQKSVQNSENSQSKLDSGMNTYVTNNGPGILFGNFGN